jgi:pimeloyl-ACP methyl ester carboxylesterase
MGAGPLVVLIHGFPEYWYSWRHQIPVLAEAGYRVMAYDCPGVGGSDRPGDVTMYDANHVSANVLALADSIGVDRFVLVGHDWGSHFAWDVARLHPDRLAGLVAMGVTPSRYSRPPIEHNRERFAGRFMHVVRHQKPGVSDAELAADPRDSLLRHYVHMSGDGDFGAFFRQRPEDSPYLDFAPRPDQLPSWITEDEFQHFLETFATTGFTGGLNYYRALDLTHEIVKPYYDIPIETPALFIAGDRDAAFMPKAVRSKVDYLKEIVPGLRGIEILGGIGHWTQQEAPEEVNRLLLHFLAGIEVP